MNKYKQINGVTFSYKLTTDNHNSIEVNTMVTVKNDHITLGSTFTPENVQLSIRSKHEKFDLFKHIELILTKLKETE